MYSGFFDFLRHFKHNYAIKASIFTKLGDFSLKYQNLSKFSAPSSLTDSIALPLYPPTNKIQSANERALNWNFFPEFHNPALRYYL